MPWLVVTWFLALGYVPLQYESVYRADLALDPARTATVAEIGLEALVGEHFRIHGSIENFQYFNREGWQTGGAFLPYRADYTFGVEFVVNEHLAFEARHECDHVIKQGNHTEGYESSETLVLVKLKGQTRF